MLVDNPTVVVVSLSLGVWSVGFDASGLESNSMLNQKINCRFLIRGCEAARLWGPPREFESDSSTDISVLDGTDSQIYVGITTRVLDRMAKTKSKQGPRKAAGTTKAAPNPFEMKKTKSRFNVLGRSLKGSSKNVVKARTDAVNRRKSSLLVEYKAMRKANQFNDKRFGQNDAKMSE